MKPWREVAVPHPDVLEGTFLQSEFAADITAVRTGQAKGKGQGQAHAGQGHAQDQAEAKSKKLSAGNRLGH